MAKQCTKCGEDLVITTGSEYCPKGCEKDKHIIQEGSRQHVVRYDSLGRHCSEPNCEINFEQEPQLVCPTPCKKVCWEKYPHSKCRTSIRYNHLGEDCPKCVPNRLRMVCSKGHTVRFDIDICRNRECKDYEPNTALECMNLVSTSTETEKQDPECADITWIPVTVWTCPKCGKSTAVDSKDHDQQVIKDFAARVEKDINKKKTYGGNAQSTAFNRGLRVAREIVKSMAEKPNG